MNELPGYVWALVLVGVIGIPTTTCAMLFRGALQAGLRRRTAVIVAGGAGILLGGWIVASAVLAAAGVYERQTAWLGVAFAGLLIALLAATQIPAVSHLLAGSGTAARLALPHTLRVVGVTFLIVMALGHLPAVFALPAGLGDFAVGISAPFVALRLARGSGRRRAVWFNVMGIVDLVVALGIANLAGLGPYHPFDIAPTTEALSVLPLGLIPTTAVPLAIALHIVSLRRLASSPDTQVERPARLAPDVG